jgi:glycine dehydrogenase subunit 1
MPFIPHTEEDITKMLQVIGATDINSLFSEIPQDLQTTLHGKIAPGINELAITKFMQKKSDLDYGISNYIGAGAYEHHIPAAVWEIAGRGEFMTSYTPYQAEASQGNLQLIYEYQTMMCNLTGMDVSNASLYDGASALAEAVLMSVRGNTKVKSKTVLVMGAINPSYLDTVNTIVSHQGIEVVISEYSLNSGTTTSAELQKYNLLDLAAVVIVQPNFFGQLEDVDNITNWAHAKNALVIGVVNPTSLALLEAPSNWGDKGADIVCGEGQPLGVPLASGGPYFGFQCCRMALVRQMPGRIVGRTVDEAGKPGFTLTLQAREQHIRRSKATSNICTNQGLLVTAATIYLSLLGAEGLKRVAAQCWNNTQYLTNKLCQVKGITRKFIGDNFHEVVLQFDKPLSKIIECLNKHNIAAGLDLTPFFPKQLENCLLVCVTETKDEQDMDFYVNTLQKIMQEV